MYSRFVSINHANGRQRHEAQPYNGHDRYHEKYPVYMFDVEICETIYNEPRPFLLMSFLLRFHDVATESVVRIYEAAILSSFNTLYLVVVERQNEYMSGRG